MQLGPLFGDPGVLALGAQRLVDEVRLGGAPDDQRDSLVGGAFQVRNGGSGLGEEPAVISTGLVQD